MIYWDFSPCIFYRILKSRHGHGSMSEFSASAEGWWDTAIFSLSVKTSVWNESLISKFRLIELLFLRLHWAALNPGSPNQAPCVLPCLPACHSQVHQALPWAGAGALELLPCVLFLPSPLLPAFLSLEGEHLVYILKDFWKQWGAGGSNIYV